MGEAAARDVAFRNKEIDASILGPAQYIAYQAEPELSKGHLLEVAEVLYPQHGHETRISSRSRISRQTGDQLRDQFGFDHQATCKGKGLPRDELASAFFACLRQKLEALRLRPGKGQEAFG